MGTQYIFNRVNIYSFDLFCYQFSTIIMLYYFLKYQVSTHIQKYSSGWVKAQSTLLVRTPTN